jgi:hypothetical protein
VERVCRLSNPIAVINTSSESGTFSRSGGEQQSFHRSLGPEPVEGSKGLEERCQQRVQTSVKAGESFAGRALARLGRAGKAQRRQGAKGLNIFCWTLF